MTTVITTKTNVGAVNAIFEAFRRGEIPAIVDTIADRFTWDCHFDPIVPWGGRRSTKAEVYEFFQAIADNVEVLGFDPQEMISEGDTVVASGTFSCRGKRTGKEATTRWVFIWKFSQGKVVSYEQFHDPSIEEVFRD